VRRPTPADAKARAQVQLPDGTLATLVWTPALTRKPAANGQGATMALVVVAGKHHRVTATTLRVLLP
jgi:hypothetical protein